MLFHRCGDGQQAKSTKSARAPKRTLYSADRSLSRKAKLARARAVAMSREMAETTLPRYKVDASGDLVPDVRAAAAIIYDPETNQILWEENSQSQRSIASITKMMTATVFFEDNRTFRCPSPWREATCSRPTTHLRANDRVTPDDLLHLLLIASDNAAARALAISRHAGPRSFIRRMNEKAAELGLESTHYADPSGLLSDNVSSAYDMARLITQVSGDERIASIMRTPEYTIYSKRGPITFRSTNHLLGRPDVDVRSGKTGFISSSGYCLATLLRLPQGGQQVAVVVLGPFERGPFHGTRNLFSWLSTKASTIFATTPPPPLPAQQQQ